MKERPILFSAPMVRAILDGNKTQTRRSVKFNDRLNRYDSDGFHRVTDETIEKKPWSENAVRQIIGCPYGQPGDRLWVREAFEDCCSALHSCVLYRADGDDPGTKWTPSIHMPRWASRITLEVTGVRAERLQDISEVDAMAEGITRLTEPLPPRRWSGPNRFTLKGMGSGACAGSVSLNAPAAEDLYRRLWESINGPGSWDLNPWVWVVEFKRLPEDRK